MKRLIIAGFVALVGGLSAQGEQLLPSPPYVCVGRILNYEQLNIAELTDSATISVYNSAGTCLATSPVQNFEDSVNNYRLIIPVASQSTATAAAPGDSLDVKVSYGGKVYTTLQGFTLDRVGAAGTVHVHDLVICSDESPKNGIADEYELGVQARLADEQGVTDAVFDPDDDYDGDGVSNRDEYLAGTDPLWAEDKFTLVAFAPHPENPDLLMLTFTTTRAKTYQLHDAPELAQKPDWQVADFRETPDGDAQSAYHTPSSDAPVEKTIYIPKAAAPASARFFHIRVN